MSVIVINKLLTSFSVNETLFPRNSRKLPFVEMGSYLLSFRQFQTFLLWYFKKFTVGGMLRQQFCT